MQSVRDGLRLHRGLDLMAASLLLIPLIPVVLLLNQVLRGGDKHVVRLGLLVVLQQGLWLVGLWVATECARRHAATRGVGWGARAAAVVDTLATGLYLTGVALATRGDGRFFDLWLSACLVCVLLARGVSIWAGSVAVAAVLRALCLPRVARGLEMLAALGFVGLAATTTGLAMVFLSADAPRADTNHLGGREGGFFVLVVALPVLGAAALAAGVWCAVAALRLNHRFGRVAAALRSGRGWG